MAEREFKKGVKRASITKASTESFRIRRRITRMFPRGLERGRGRIEECVTSRQATNPPSVLRGQRLSRRPRAQLRTRAQPSRGDRRYHNDGDERYENGGYPEAQIAVRLFVAR